MNLLFWRKKKADSLSPDRLAWNLVYTATDPEKCWELASLFRGYGVPNNVLTCETSFLMGSISRDIIRSTLQPELHEMALLSAEASYDKIFQDASSEEMPPEMLAVYTPNSLEEVARTALVAYGQFQDSLPLTLSVFVRRIKGHGFMKSEIQPLLEEKSKILRAAFKDLLGPSA